VGGRYAGYGTNARGRVNIGKIRIAKKQFLKEYRFNANTRDTVSIYTEPRE